MFSETAISYFWIPLATFFACFLITGLPGLIVLALTFLGDRR